MINYTREQLVLVIESLHDTKGYKLETLYLAVSLADRFLAKTMAAGEPKPCLLTLPVTCLIIAAKIHEEMSPSVTRMLALMDDKFQIKLRRRNVLKLEELIIKTLDFNLQSVSPITFLERYLRLFGLDDKSNMPDRQIASLSKQYCKFMQRDVCFLHFKPS